MPNDVFISYSRKDQEFVTRLASDLEEKVAGVWFDRSDIQAGQKWQDELANGIRECKVMILVLSPDSAESKWVKEEVNKAIELNKRIIPILYRPVNLTGGFKELVDETQYLDLRSGSYTDNFQKLVDGIVAAGAARQTLTNLKRPFLREPVATDWGSVIGKTPGWGCAWGIGWGIFWAILIVALIVLNGSQGNDLGSQDFMVGITIALSGMSGGLIGGLLAGLITMITLRRYAPSVSWKHMSPVIRIWALSGILGAILSGLATAFLLAINVIAVEHQSVDCAGLSFGDCLGKSLGQGLAEGIGLAIITGMVFVLLLAAAWFITGIVAGRYAVKHIRTLEPGITNPEGWSVSLGWGCGAIVALITTFIAIGVISTVLGVQ